MQRRTVVRAGLAVLGSSGAAGVWAQSYPNRPVQLLVPFAVGGTTDIVARAVAEKVAPFLGQPLRVENKAGNGGLLAATETAHAVPDGYALGMATVSTVASNPAINPKVSYNPLTDFTPIIGVAATPNVIAVHPSFPAHDYKGFVAELKRNPGRYSYASAGIGTINHLQMELFKSLAGVYVLHIPYRGSLPALNDTAMGQVPMIFDNMPSALSALKEGRLIPIVVAAPRRLSMLPDVPTFAEVGMGPVNRMAFYGIYGPRGLPREVVDKVNSAVRRTLELPEVRKSIEDTGSQILGTTPEQFAAQIKAEFDVYKQVVAKQKLKLE